MSISTKCKSILWEYNLSKLNLEDDIVVERVLMLWDKNITDYWINELWKKRAKELFIKNKSKLDKKSLNYWWIIFWVEIEKKLNSNKSMYEKLNEPIFSRSFK